MKKVSLLIILLLSTGILAQETTPAKKGLRPETPLVIKNLNGDYVRNMTAGQMWSEIRQYEAEKTVTNGAYRETGRATRNFIIPMAPAVREQLNLQQAHFVKTATAPLAAVPLTPVRANEGTLEIGYNQVWGNTSTFAAYVDALAKIYGSQASRAMHAHLNAGGYVFGQDIKALEFGGDWVNNGNPTASVYLRVFGQTKFSASTPTLYKHVFFTGELGKEVEFFVGPIPISVYGAIGGTAGFDAQIAPAGNGIEGRVTPYLDTYGKANAGVDLWFVKAGVEGQLVLLKDQLPVIGTAQLVTENGLAVELGLTVENHLKALSGSIVVFADVYDLWEDEWDRYSTTLFSWGGLAYDWTLYNKTCRIPLN
jgi:hypothetical protein